ncbi:hypothetical protein [Paraliobacillus ryukyuensis]|uniref:hypothetical protein n=1 Tax=Paraliobacillus ryukyuensis TaxID=200904 RepID=UPI0009A7ABC3|nr:hypothetical protein [Paraliobacillus ryukyuensis]
METIIKRSNKRDLSLAIWELSKRGWEAVGKYKEITDTPLGSTSTYDSRNYGSMRKRYYIRMRKSD